MDRRQQKTRAAIFKAFSRLLENKHFNNITVQEIIDEANIGRSTFYAHFETKDELLRNMCTDIFNHVFSDELISEKSHDFSEGNKDLRERLTHILYHFQDSKKDIKKLLYCESESLFMKFFKEYLFEMFKLYVDKTEHIVPKDYLMNCYVTGYAETVKWWMKNTDEYSPEEVVDFFFNVINL